MAPGHKHQLVTIYLTDSKQHPRPSGQAVAAKATEEASNLAREAENHRRHLQERIRQVKTRLADPGAEAFAKLAATAAAGVEIVVAPQLYPTPPDLAARMVDLADIEAHHRVLEPSAGTGHLLRAIGPGPDKVAVEIHPRLVELLVRSGISGVQIHQQDFLACNGNLGSFDRIVMNPPFGKGEDIKHILHAAKMLRPGGCSWRSAPMVPASEKRCSH
jgi:hypothetical protein